MILIDRRIFEYTAMYYDFNQGYEIPENITICIPEDYERTIKKCAVDFFGSDSEVPDTETDGMLLASNKGEYFIGLNIDTASLPEGIEILPEQVNTLFHELSHIHTLPETDLFELKEYDAKTPGAKGIDGFMYWRELTATLMGMRTFINTCGIIEELESEDKQFATCMEKIEKQKQEGIETMVSGLLLSDINIFPRLKKSLLENTYTALKDLVDETCRHKDYNTLGFEEYDKLGRILERLKE